MIEPFKANFLTPTKPFRELSVLLAIHDSPRHSQHRIGRITHLSSSMVNNYIKKFHREGLITVTGETNRSQAYHLTPAGRERLITHLLSYSAELVQLYGATKREIAERLGHFEDEGIHAIALYGAAETAEVVYAALKDTSLRVLGVVDGDPAKQGRPFNGFEVQAPQRLRDMAVDAVVITSFARQEEIHQDIRALLGENVRVKKLSDL